MNYQAIATGLLAIAALGQARAPVDDDLKRVAPKWKIERITATLLIQHEWMIKNDPGYEQFFRVNQVKFINAEREKMGLPPLVADNRHLETIYNEAHREHRQARMSRDSPHRMSRQEAHQPRLGNPNVLDAATLVTPKKTKEAKRDRIAKAKAADKEDRIAQIKAKRKAEADDRFQPLEELSVPEE